MISIKIHTYDWSTRWWNCDHGTLRTCLISTCHLNIGCQSTNRCLKIVVVIIVFILICVDNHHLFNNCDGQEIDSKQNVMQVGKQELTPVTAPMTKRPNVMRSQLLKPKFPNPPGQLVAALSTLEWRFDKSMTYLRIYLLICLVTT